MRVAIAGGHGQIALRLAKVLSERGDEPVALIRNPDHADDVKQVGRGGRPRAAERGGGRAGCRRFRCRRLRRRCRSGERARAQGDGGLRRCGEADRAAKKTGVGRYVIVSSMGANPDAPGDDTFSVYLRAKGRADDAVRASGLDWTIVRPGGLTNDAGTGRVTLGENLPQGQIARDDVAAVLAAVLDSPNTIGRTVDLIGGDTPVAEAVEAI